MPIKITCPNCNKAGRVPDQVSGKTIKCPKCGTRFPVKVSIPPADFDDLLAPLDNASPDSSQPLSRMTIPIEVLERIPPDIARTFKIMPIALSKDGRTLTVALAESASRSTLSYLRSLLDIELKVVVTPDADVLEAIGSHADAWPDVPASRMKAGQSSDTVALQGGEPVSMGPRQKSPVVVLSSIVLGSIVLFLAGWVAVNRVIIWWHKPETKELMASLGVVLLVIFGGIAAIFVAYFGFYFLLGMGEGLQKSGVRITMIQGFDTDKDGQDDFFIKTRIN